MNAESNDCRRITVGTLVQVSERTWAYERMYDPHKSDTDVERWMCDVHETCMVLDIQCPTNVTVECLVLLPTISRTGWINVEALETL